MSDSLPAERSFDCEFCQGVIKIPYDLAPTKAPCPYCGQELLSPPVPKAGAEVKAPVLTPVLEEAPKLAADRPEVPPAFPGVPKLVEVGGAASESKGGKVPAVIPGPPASVPPGNPAAPKSSAPPIVPAAPKSSAPSIVPAAPKSSAPPIVPAAPKSSAPPIVPAAPGSAAPGSTPPASKSAVPKPEAPPLDSVTDDAVAPEALVGAARSAAKSEAGIQQPKVKKRKLKEHEKSRKVSPLIFFVAGVAMVTLAIVALFLLNRGNKENPAQVPVAQSQEAERVKFLREGWKDSASVVMEGFLKAETVEEKARFVIGGEARIPEMAEFYLEREIIDQATTPLDAFSHEDLVMADKERGLFMMRYDRPSQFAMNEFFRPVAPLEVQYKVESPDALLANTASVENFAMEPVRILAFFKHDGEKLRLDWDVFVQTKYRLLKEFIATPQPGARQVFRVRLYEDVPSVAGEDLSEIRHYRCLDPAYDSDYAKVPVVVDSALGRHLSALNWVGIKDATIKSRGATVELAWTDDGDPRIYMKRLLCWEYLGLGGVMGNLSLTPGDESAKVDLDRHLAGR